MSSRRVQRLLGLEDEAVARSATRILVAAVVIVGLGVAIAMSTSQPAMARFFDNVYWTVSYAAAAALAWLGTRTGLPRAKVTKRWFAWALTLYAVGQVLWDIQVASGWNPFPGPSDLFYLCLGPLTGLGCIGLLSHAAARTDRRTALLDSSGLSVAVLAMTLALYLPKRGDLELLPLAFLVAYPVVLCWAASCAMTMILALRLRPSLGLGLFIAGLFGNAALWLQWNLLTLDNALTDGTLLNSLFAVGALAQGTGVLALRTQPLVSKRWERFCEGTLRLLPLFIVVVCSAAVVVAFTLPHVPAPVRWSALVGGLLVVVLATLRQSVLLGERERLVETERDLRKVEETFRVLVEQAPEGIFIADTNGVYQDVNTRGADMLGMLREEVIGARIDDIVAKDEVPRIAPELERLVAGETVHSAWLFQRKDGSKFHGDVTAKQLPDGRVLGFVRDVSQRRALEAQLRQSQKMEAMGVLAAGIAHDFNNMLTAIRGNVSLAAQDVGDNHAALASLADIERAAERATQLVQRILAFSRPSPPDPAEVSLTSLVQEVVRLLRPSLPVGVELNVMPAAVSPIVSADPVQLHQVLMNLCANAWQAMRGKTGRIELSVTTRKLYAGDADLELRPGNYACLSVTDTGQGMSSATQERIFEPFFTTKPPGEGTGLGLSVVHSIIRTHLGALRVKSSPGRGATFTIYLPLVTVRGGELERGASPQLPSRIHDGPLRVAYVDDEEPVVTVMTRQLERRGYRVHGFASPVDFLQQLQAGSIACDVIVTDYNMPDMSGIELMRAIKEFSPGAAFVLTSGYVSEELLAAAAQLGVKSVVRKPESIERLCSAIDDAAESLEISIATSSAIAG